VRLSSVDCEFETGGLFFFELGSGFISTDSYQHGFFSASVKLPRGYTAGVVVAFYVSFPD
jgi:Glycosyl hydrolases family 16